MRLSHWRLGRARRVVGAYGLAVSIAVLAVGMSALPASATTLTMPRTCVDVTLPVRIADPGTADNTMWGELCYKGSVIPNTVQLLVAGATYNHTYWDSSYGNTYYSYVKSAIDAGYATFDVDRVGTGASSHPDGSLLNVAAGAVALHDVITALRAGQVASHAFTRVIWVGHSFGSIHGWEEIARYHDVDAAILTGLLHARNPTGHDNAVANTYPAVYDPAFANSGLDTSYLTTKPGSRELLYYASQTADSGEVANDEATKDTETSAQLGDLDPLLALAPADAPSQQVTVPVLLLVGAYDNFFCGVAEYDCTSAASILQFEQQYYPASAHLQVVTIANTGHDVALSTTVQTTDSAMIQWAQATIAP